MSKHETRPEPPVIGSDESTVKAGRKFRSGRASVQALAPGAATEAEDPAATLDAAEAVTLPAARPVNAEPESDRYRVTGQLGEGGMGEVLLAFDQDIHRPVAMKTLRGKLKQSRFAHERFFEEVRVAGQLEHPAITPVHDVGIGADGSPYYTMRYVRGETLGDIIARLRAGGLKTHERWPFERRVQLGLQVLSAMHHAHQAGVIHRDLKPSNIMVGKSDEVFVIDWGLAQRDEDRARAAGERQGLEGTPRYMSPEQARRENAELDERSDLYAFCAVLYELLTLSCHLGDLPADASARDVVERVKEHTPVPAEEIHHPAQRRVPRELSLVLERGLARDREERFQSATELRDALHAYLEGTAPVVCAHTGMVRLLMTLKRATDAHDRLVIYGALLLMTLAGVGTASIAYALWFVLRA